MECSAVPHKGAATLELARSKEEMTIFITGD
jgi:hypothetical protein